MGPTICIWKVLLVLCVFGFRWIGSVSHSQNGPFMQHLKCYKIIIIIIPAFFKSDKLIVGGHLASEKASSPEIYDDNAVTLWRTSMAKLDDKWRWQQFKVSACSSLTFVYLVRLQTRGRIVSFCTNIFSFAVAVSVWCNASHDTITWCCNFRFSTCSIQKWQNVVLFCISW